MIEKKGLSMENQQEEKRIAKRLITESLFIVIEDQVSLSFASIDYNAYGIAILSDLNLSIEDEIVITIGNDDGFVIADIDACIMNKSLLTDRDFRYGLKFIYNKNMSENKIKQLKTLENMLNVE